MNIVKRFGNYAGLVIVLAAVLAIVIYSGLKDYRAFAFGLAALYVVDRNISQVLEYLKNKKGAE